MRQAVIRELGWKKVRFLTFDKEAFPADGFHNQSFLSLIGLSLVRTASLRLKKEIQKCEYA